jgi:hypothetical protein
MSKKSQSHKGDKGDHDESIDIVSDSILAIFETPEILNLIEEEQSMTIEISRPLITPLSETGLTSGVLREEDCEIDLTDHSNIERKLRKIKKIKSSNYRKEILNGINRWIDSDRGNEICFEERCYLITDPNTVSWIVTVRNRCSSDLIPTIIDYDQDQTIKESVYANGVREIKDVSNAQIRYDLFQELDTDIVANGSFDDILEEARGVVTKIDRTYQSIFE